MRDRDGYVLFNSLICCLFAVILVYNVLIQMPCDWNLFWSSI